MTAVINDTGILVVLVALVLLFGASRIPKLARKLGEASKEFRTAQEQTHGQETVTVPRDQLDALIASTTVNRSGPDRTQVGS